MKMKPFILVAALCLISVAPVAGQEDCAGWGSLEFFRRATAEQVASCLEAGADVNAVDDDGATPLHEAARGTRDSVVIAILVQAGAAIDARDRRGQTPLHRAAW